MACIVDHSVLWSYRVLGPSASRFDLTGLAKGNFVIERHRFTISPTVGDLAVLAGAKNLSLVIKIPSVSPKQQHIFTMASYLTLPPDTRKRVILYVGGELENSQRKLMDLSSIPWYVENFPDLKTPYFLGPAGAFDGKSFETAADLEAAIGEPYPERDIQKRCAIAPPLMRVVQKEGRPIDKFLESLTFDLDVGVFDASEVALVFIPLNLQGGTTTEFRVVAFQDNRAVAFVNRSKVISFEKATPANSAAFVAFLQAVEAHPLDFTLDPSNQEDPELLVSALATGIPLTPYLRAETPKVEVSRAEDSGVKIEQIEDDVPLKPNRTS